MNITVPTPVSQTRKNLRKHQVVAICGIVLGLSALAGAAGLLFGAPDNARNGDAPGALLAFPAAIEAPTYVTGYTSEADHALLWLGAAPGPGTEAAINNAPGYVAGYASEAEHDRLWLGTP